jgi:hypothetical protein
MEHERHDRGDGGAAAQMASVSSHMNPYVNGVVRAQSPPWREDDKDGHYTFELGENITPRCNDPTKSHTCWQLWFMPVHLSFAVIF